MSVQHPGREMLLAHADGELSVSDHASIAAHLDVCAACVASVAELRSSSVQFGGALLLLDRAEPAEWNVPVETAAVEPHVIPLRHREAPRPRRSAAPLRWAAGILLAGGAASAAIIGADDLLERVRPTAEPEPAAPATPVTVAAVIVAPVEGALAVNVSQAGAGARIIVAPEERSDAEVSVEGGDSPHFTPGPGRLDVDLRGASATLRVRLPRNVSATIVSGGAPLITVRDGVVNPARAATEGIEAGTTARSQRE